MRPVHRKPSLWRAWSPVIYQVAGVGVIVASSVTMPILGLVGAGLWLYGLTQRPR